MGRLSPLWFGPMSSGCDGLRAPGTRLWPSVTFWLTQVRAHSHRGRSSPRDGPRSWSKTYGPAGQIAEPAAAMDAFDADVLIYAAAPDHELGAPVRALFPTDAPRGAEVLAGIGSVLLLPELLTKPLRDDAQDELLALGLLLSRIALIPT